MKNENYRLLKSHFIISINNILIEIIKYHSLVFLFQKKAIILLHHLLGSLLHRLPLGSRLPLHLLQSLTLLQPLHPLALHLLLRHHFLLSRPLPHPMETIDPLINHSQHCLCEFHCY